METRPRESYRGKKQSFHPNHLLAFCTLTLWLGASLSATAENATAKNAVTRALERERAALWGRENLALQAEVSAGSELSQNYSAAFAVDGKIPDRGSQADTKQAWAVDGATHKQASEFVLEWKRPVTAAEIVYYGRTSYEMGECWKDYELYLDDADKPLVCGQLEKKHGPQRIRFQPNTVDKITLKFTSSYNGSNPGASEITVHATSPSESKLEELERLAADIDRLLSFDSSALRGTIDDFAQSYSGAYTRGQEHRQRLGALETKRRTLMAAVETDDYLAARDARPLATEFESLARSVLLFDVDRLVLVKRHEINASHVYTYHYEGFRAGGGLYILDPHDPNASPKKLVDAGQGQMLDCELSYDGTEILFSWRKKEDTGYHLFTIDLDGSNLTQITDGPWHDYNGCWLPDGGIAFISSRESRFAYCWHAPVGVLHRMDSEGGNVQRLSANIINDFTPSVLPDGRILYSRWEYVDRPAIPIQSMWSINPDGTGLAVYFGNRVLTPGTFMEARAVPGTGKVVCTMTGHNGPTRGGTGLIDRTHGVNAQEAIRNLTPDVYFGPVDEGNGNMDMGKWGAPVTQPYGTPYPLDAMRYLVSNFGKVTVRDFAGAIQATVAKTGDDLWYYSAQPVRPRPVPPVIQTALPVSEPEPDTGYATVFVQDVYNGLTPHVKRGEIKEIRVIHEMKKTVRIDPSKRAFGFQFPVISCGATYAGKKVLGHVPVEEDGSACFQVPAGVPLYFMVLDEEGRALQRMRSFTHFMPGEVQGCIGCHEDRLQTSRPAAQSIAMARPPKALTPPEWGTDGFDYATVVQPVLDKHCVDCHNSVNPPNRIDLTGGKTDFFNVSYDVLARENQGPRGTQYVNWIPTYNGQEQNILEVTPKAWGAPQSKLAKTVLSGHPDAEGKPRLLMNETDRRRILAWIDLNVPYYGTPETAYPDRVGCRKIYPLALDDTLKDVAERRCGGCHEDGVPRRVWTRVTEPEFNDFLMAPLAKDAGGRETCGQAIFVSKDDPDYRAILRTFESELIALRETPRMDMPGAIPDSGVDRSRY